jgi:hypothetical protein
MLTFTFIVLPILFALLCLYYSLQFLKAARNIEDTPISKIRSAAQGYVALSGFLKKLNNEPIYAKFTQKPCAWYYYKVENLVTYRTEGKTTSAWHIVDQGVSVVPFLLDDGTGECAILPMGAEIIPTSKITWRGYSYTPTPPPTTFLARLWRECFGSYRYTETYLEFNAPVYASGMFYTRSQTHLSIQNNPSLNHYFNENKSSILNTLSKEGMLANQNFLVWPTSKHRLILNRKLKSFIFLIVFFFFTVLSANTTYPIVKNALKQWPNKKIFRSLLFYH